MREWILLALKPADPQASTAKDNFGQGAPNALATRRRVSYAVIRSASFTRPFGAADERITPMPNSTHQQVVLR